MARTLERNFSFRDLHYGRWEIDTDFPVAAAAHWGVIFQARNFWPKVTLEECESLKIRGRKANTVYENDQNCLIQNDHSYFIDVFWRTLLLSARFLSARFFEWTLFLAHASFERAHSSLHAFTKRTRSWAHAYLSRRFLERTLSWAHVFLNACFLSACFLERILSWVHAFSRHSFVSAHFL